MNDLDQHGYLGTTPTGEHFVISATARLRHLHLVGQTGTGKSNALLHLIAQHLTAGAGVALLDPHGDLAEQVLTFIPKARAHELVYLNPADLERPIGFNVLERVPLDLRALTADGIVAAFIHIWGETSVGARSQQVLRNSLRALMDAPTATLLCIPRLTQFGTRRAQRGKKKWTFRRLEKMHFAPRLGWHLPGGNVRAHDWRVRFGLISHALPMDQYVALGSWEWWRKRPVALSQASKGLP